jgi:hypothetical protein
MVRCGRVWRVSDGIRAEKMEEEEDIGSEMGQTS